VFYLESEAWLGEAWTRAARWPGDCDAMAEALGNLSSVSSSSSSSDSSSSDSNRNRSSSSDIMAQLHRIADIVNAGSEHVSNVTMVIIIAVVTIITLPSSGKSVPPRRVRVVLGRRAARAGGAKERARRGDVRVPLRAARAPGGGRQRQAGGAAGGDGGLRARTAAAAGAAARAGAGGERAASARRQEAAESASVTLVITIIIMIIIIVHPSQTAKDEH
jgi:hypothetical protein